MHQYYYDHNGTGRAPTGGATSRFYPTGSLYPPSPPPRRRTGGLAVLIFSIFLVLMLGLAAIVLALSSGMGEFTLSPPETTPPVIDGLPGYLPLPLPTAEARTTVARAPTGTGVALALHPQEGTQLSLQDIYDKSIPSIVGIRALRADGGGATGTGVIMTADGYIITNYHVIQGASDAEVILPDDSVHNAKLVGGDQSNDLAVLKVAANGLTPAQFGDSDALRVGDEAVAIGNPLGEELRGTMTNGIISAINRDVRSDTGNTMTLIQTTAALNSGNSGGALLNVYGQVVGITNMKMMSSYDTIEGLGFAIPSTITKTVVDALIADGKVTGRPTLGITVSTLDADAARIKSLVPGVYVVVVDERSGAHKAGLREGDVIVSADGKDLETLEDLNAAKSVHAAGERMTFKVYRDGDYLTIEVSLVEKYELDD